MIKNTAKITPMLFITSLHCKFDYLTYAQKRMTKNFFGCGNILQNFL